MKKILMLMLCAAMLLSAAACGGGNPPKASDEPQDTAPPEQSEPVSTPDAGAPDEPDSENGSELSKMFDAILNGVPDLPECGEVELTSENFSSYLFIDYIEGSEALASEAMINAVAHSAVLLKLPEGADIDSVASQIEEKADPRKWICVEAEKTIVRTGDGVILLVMSSAATADAIAANFDALWA